MVAGSENKFPKVILEEVATDGSATTTPVADHQALFLGEDGGLHLKDSAAAVTDIGGGTPDAHAASHENGGSDEIDVTGLTGAGGSAPDCEEAYLGADVTCVNADTFYDGPSMSLAAGDWEIQARVTSTDANAAATGLVARLTDGTTHYGTAAGYKPAGAGNQHQLVVNARVTLGSTTTVKVQLSSARGTSSSVMKTTGILTGEIANLATRISAIKVTSI